MKKFLLSTTLVASLFASGYEIGAGIGFSDIEKSNKFNNKTDLNLRIGKYLPKNHILRLELEKSIKGAGDKLSRTLLNIEHYFDKDVVQPYAYIGAGYQWVKSTNYADRAIADLGIGAKYDINEKVYTFLEARALRDFKNNDNHYTAILGLNYKFGFESKPLDSDNDGVIDSLDRCQNTPENVKVDTNGCAIDSDNDGIADYLDRCQNTPENVKVDTNGCAIDSDNDGVADYLDKCQNTALGTKVNQEGCPLVYNFNITFANNSAELDEESQNKIKAFAIFLRENITVIAKIEGYTDNRGDEEHNRELSQRRAQSVYEELLNLGIDANRLSYEGFGSENPIATNETPEGRATNRRVVAELIYK